MAIVNTSINAPVDGTYGMPNSIIGQLKTILLNDTNVAIVSDNDPANTTQRVLVYSIDSQNHYVKIATTASTGITIYLLKIDGSTTLASIVWSLNSSYSYSIRFLYNAKAHFLTITRSSLVNLIFWAVDIGDTTNGWYFRTPKDGASSVGYFSSSDDAGTHDFPFYSALNYSGKFVGIPVRFRLTYNLSEFYHLYMYGANSTTSPIGFLSDGTYTYLSDGYVVIADRVPS